MYMGVVCSHGSPPRMRGKADSEDAEDDGGRITPAYAGKSAWSRISLPHQRDHPRVCGEKRVKARYERVAVGITPAYAGKRLSLTQLLPVVKDHPRICGEKPSCPPAAAVGIGSPPRMRGKDVLGPVRQFLFGITPAYAGKSSMRRMVGIS